MTQRPLRVLCLDIEGGYGGSSRSLFFLLAHLDRSRASPEVWCKRDGPIATMYARHGIPVRIESALPKFSALPRLSRNVWQAAKFARDFWASAGARRRLVKSINDRFDVVHFNHESLVFLATWARSRTSAAFVMHNRTMLWDSWFARRQASLVRSANDINVFITDRERDNVLRLSEAYESGVGDAVVIHNVVDIPQVLPTRHDALPDDGRFTLATLANFSSLRGTDRLVDIALALKKASRGDIRFAVAGKDRLSGNLPGLLGDISRRGGTLADYANARGVGDMFVFLGHVSDPERVLAASDVLIKTSRENNPWGRDLLEAMALGLPVMACGDCETFVQPRKTGFLYPHDGRFDASRVAADIQDLAADRSRARQLGLAGQELVKRLCDGPTQAAKLLDVWEKAHALRAAQRTF